MATYNTITLFLALSICLFFLLIFRLCFNRTKIPRFITEIGAGYFIGPAVLASFFPFWQKILSTDFVQHIFFALKDIGLVALMFYSGAEIGQLKYKLNLRICISGVLLGIGVPALIFLATDNIWPQDLWTGAQGSPLKFKMILILSMAVTSIPVISRIFLDLGMFKSTFAQQVIAIALVEDFILYAVLNSLLNNNAMHFDQSLFWEIAKHTFYSISFLLLFFFIKKPFYKILQRFISSFSLKEDYIYLIYLYALLMGIVYGASLFNILPMLSSFACGLVFGAGNTETSNRLSEKFKDFSFSTVIPFYFLAVGMHLQFTSFSDLCYLILFFGLSSFGKIFGGFLAGIFSKKNLHSALSLGITLNARGGPGIVIATLSLEKKLITVELYNILIFTAICTSAIAYSFLEKNKEKLEKEFV